jgi:hypothetical protein
MKRFLLIAFLACLTIVALGWWYGRQRLFSERRIAVAQADAAASALDKLIDTTDFAGQDRAWGDLLTELAARCDVPLQVDEAEAKSMGVDRQTRVYVPAGVFPLGELLDEITGGMDLGWRRSGGSIEITSISEAESGRLLLSTRVYPLPAANGAGETLIDDAEALCELITTHIVPESWEEVGGQGVIEPAGGALVVRQTDAIHGLIREFLSQMESSGGWRHELAENPVADDEEQRIARALAEVDSVDFRDTPLDEALQTLTARHGLRFQFSAEALANGAANPAIPVTLSLSRVALRTILRELLGAQQLTFVVRSGSFEVTTIDAAESQLIHGVYDVRDLVETSGRPDFDSLIELITTTVEPDSWDEVGGPGTIAEMGDRWLVVSQTEDIQQKVQRTLARVRALLEPGVDPAADALLEPTDDVSPAVQRALDQEVTLKCVRQPLSILCDDVSRQLRIPIVLRHTRLAEIAVAPDVPISIDLPPLPLRDALALMLEQHQLTFDPRGEVLYITTPHDADVDLVTRIIDVRHLLDTARGGMDDDTLIELITTCVEPDMWDETGGPGTQQVFRGLLVFRQTFDVSRQVQDLIDALSEHCLLPSAFGGTEVPPADALPQPVWVGLTSAEVEMLGKLSTRDEFHVAEVRWDKALQDVANRCGIPVVVDRNWIEEEWGGGGEPPWHGKSGWNVSLDIKDATVEQILRTLAREAQGNLCVARGVVLITSPQEAESQMLRRLYPLGIPRADDIPHHAHDVTDYLVGRLQPDTWGDNGGYGTIEAVNDEWLLVVQTLPMHRRVEEALAKLRAGEMLPMPPTIPVGSWDPLASPAIGTLWRLMRRMVPWAGAYDAE